MIFSVILVAALAFHSNSFSFITTHLHPQNTSTRPPSFLFSSTPASSTTISTPSSSSSSSSTTNNLTKYKLSTPEKSRTVTSYTKSGTLSTLSVNPDIVDAPFGSHVDFVLDSSGSPILLMNEISMHTVNIDQSAKGSGTLVTLFAQLPVGEGQSVSRVSVTGTIAKVPETSEELDAMKMSFSIAHSYYDQIASSPKFSFYKLTPVKIYYVGGFGVQSSWVDIKDYESAQADIIAKEGATIVTKLNKNNMGDLKIVCEHLLGIESVEKVRIASVDRLGIDVRCTYKNRKGKIVTDVFRIGFRVEVISIEDAKSEILKIFQEAWEIQEGEDWGEDEEDDEVEEELPVFKLAKDAT